MPGCDHELRSTGFIWEAEPLLFDRNRPDLASCDSCQRFREPKRLVQVARLAIGKDTDSKGTCHFATFLFGTQASFPASAPQSSSEFG